MLEILTFTGIDERTGLEEIREISARYPRAEFAVLVGSQTGQGNPLFPPWETVRQLRNLGPGVRTAIHLCGSNARQAAGEETLSNSLQLLCAGFGRIQVNLHPDGDDPRRVEVQTAGIKRFAERTGTGSVILQHRGPWETIPVEHVRIEYLFDLSEGSGQEGFEHWPPPPAGRRVGYAGGLGPHNIRRALEFLGQHPEAPVWLDMERNIRTEDYWLDLGKVREVCGLALDQPGAGRK